MKSEQARQSWRTMDRKLKVGFVSTFYRGPYKHSTSCHWPNWREKPTVVSSRKHSRPQGEWHLMLPAERVMPSRLRFWRAPV